MDQDVTIYDDYLQNDYYKQPNNIHDEGFYYKIFLVEHPLLHKSQNMLQHRRC